MRTNIVLSDDLVREAFQYSQAPSKRSLIEEALRVFISAKAAERRAATYKDRVRELDRKLAGLVVRERPYSILRKDRERI